VLGNTRIEKPCTTYAKLNEYGMDAKWNFFATTHGKSPCDGIGGTVKRLTTAENLAHPPHNQILSNF